MGHYSRVHICMIPRRTLALAVMALALPLGCGLASPPGNGPVAERGYRLCKPAIEALSAYHQRHGDYPELLELLVSAGDLEAIPEPPEEDHLLDYERLEDETQRIGAAANHTTPWAPPQKAANSRSKPSTSGPPT